MEVYVPYYSIYEVSLCMCVQAYCTGRGEIVEDVPPPLALSTPLLLVKPPVGLATPKIFKSLDLGRRSTADPLELLKVWRVLCVGIRYNSV